MKQIFFLWFVNTPIEPKDVAKLIVIAIFIHLQAVVHSNDSIFNCSRSRNSFQKFIGGVGKNFFESVIIVVVFYIHSAKIRNAHRSEHSQTKTKLTYADITRSSSFAHPLTRFQHLHQSIALVE